MHRDGIQRYTYHERSVSRKMNIYVGRDLRRRMEDFMDDHPEVNWSQVAQLAFDNLISQSESPHAGTEIEAYDWL